MLMKSVALLFSETKDRIIKKIPDASFELISYTPNRSVPTGYHYKDCGSKYILQVIDMGRLLWTQEFYTEEDCIWSIIENVIMNHPGKKNEKESLFLRFADEYPEKVQSSIRSLPL